METHGVPIEELLDDVELFANSTLRVEDERLEGMAMTKQKEGGFSLTLSFTSYQYERGGETHWNHVPHVTVVAPDGRIVAEPSAADSSYRARAFANGLNTVEYVFDNLKQYLK